MEFGIMEMEINNFRGYRNVKFTFNSDDKLIILSGPNGYGKTSFIDAVEWCLTGKVERISQESRIRGESHLVLMKKGLIRNIHSNNEPVSVKLKLLVNNQVVNIERSSNTSSDSYTGDETLISITDNEGQILNQSIDETLNGEFDSNHFFYNHFICSQYKNLKFYEKGRNDIYELFKLYFGENEEIENIISKLNNIKSGLESELEKCEEKDDELKIKTNQELKKENIEELINKYNSIVINKNQEIEGNLDTILKNKENYKKNLEEIKSVKETIELDNMTNQMISHKDYRYKKREYEMFKEKIYYKFFQNWEVILRTQDYKISKILNNQKNTNELLTNLKTIDKNNDASKNISNLINQIDFFEKKQIEKINISISELERLEDKLKNVNSLIKKKEQQDGKNKAISTLLSNAQIWVKYVNDNKECPLCKRPNLEVGELKKAIEETEKLQDEKAKELSDLIDKRKTIKSKKNDRVNDVVELLEKKLRTKNKELLKKQSEYENVSNYYDKCRKYNLEPHDLSFERIYGNLAELYNHFKKEDGKKYVQYEKMDLSILEEKIETNKNKLDKAKNRELHENIGLKRVEDLISYLSRILEILENLMYIDEKKENKKRISKIESGIKKIKGLETKVK
ncbi:MAG: AAA family ATPase, partial [Bacillota bacterium]